VSVNEQGMEGSAALKSFSVKCKRSVGFQTENSWTVYRSHWPFGKIRHSFVNAVAWVQW